MNELQQRVDAHPADASVHAVWQNYSFAMAYLEQAFAHLSRAHNRTGNVAYKLDLDILYDHAGRSRCTYSLPASHAHLSGQDGMLPP